MEAKLGKRRIHAGLFVALTVVLSACSGTGDGLDENGRPLDGNATPAPSPGAASNADAKLAEIQAEIFSPVCSGCHAGGNAPLGLRLSDVDTSYSALVNVPSAQVPERARVVPGDAESSYLIHKVEGRQEVGARMPRGFPPLNETEIQLLRDWIDAGAAPASQAKAADTRMVLTPIWPLPGGTLMRSSSIVISSSVPIDDQTLYALDPRLTDEHGQQWLVQVSRLTDSTVLVQPIAPSGAYELRLGSTNQPLMLEFHIAGGPLL